MDKNNAPSHSHVIGRDISKGLYCAVDTKNNDRPFTGMSSYTYAYRVCLSSLHSILTLTSSCQLCIWKNSIEIFNLSCCFILPKKICILGNSSPLSVRRPCRYYFTLKVIKIIKMNPRQARCWVNFCEMFSVQCSHVWKWWVRFHSKHKAYRTVPHIIIHFAIARLIAAKGRENVLLYLRPWDTAILNESY